MDNFFKQDDQNNGVFADLSGTNQSANFSGASRLPAHENNWDLLKENELSSDLGGRKIAEEQVGIDETKSEAKQATYEPQIEKEAYKSINSNENLVVPSFFDEGANHNIEDNQETDQVITNDNQDSLNYVSERNGAGNDFLKNKNKGSGLGKLFLLLGIPLVITGGVASFFVKRVGEINYQTNQGIVLIEPMKDTNWKDIGEVFEPLIDIPVKTLSGYKEQEFLLDSGAVISSLPRDWAEKMGKDIDLMKRSTFKGFGGVKSFAYQGEMTILIAEEEKEIPVVFTEATETKSLIGRKGFFQDYSVYFNHKDKQIEIRK